MAETAEAIDELVDGALDAERAQALDRALAADPRLLAQAMDLLAVDRLLRLAADDAFAGGVRAGLHGERERLVAGVRGRLRGGIRRRRLLAFAAAAAAALLAVAGWWTLRPTDIATVLDIHTGLSLTRDGRRTALAVGARLRAGDGVAVRRGGHATLALADGSRLVLGEGSALTLAPLRLERGSVAVEAARPLAIATPRCRIMVRGTAFRVDESRGRTRVQVAHGLVTVERSDDGRSADLAAEQEIEVAPGQPFAARTLGRRAAIHGFRLLDNRDDAPLPGGALADGAVISLRALATANLDIEAVAEVPRGAALLFLLDGLPLRRAETGWPYTLVGDALGDGLRVWTLEPGRHTLSAHILPRPGADPAAALASASLAFEVTE